MKTLITVALLTCISLCINAQTTNKETSLKVTKYYESGKPKAEGVVVNDKKEGEWIYYHENGKVALKKNFVNGVEKGEWAYYNEDGNLSLKIDDICRVNTDANVYQYKNGKIVNTKNVSEQNISIKQKF